jgi:hypothetical protein
MKHGDIVYACQDIANPPRILTGRYTQYTELPEAVVLYADHKQVYKSEDLDRWFLTPAEAIRSSIVKVTKQYQEDLAKLDFLLQGLIHAGADPGRQQEQDSGNPGEA